MISPVVQYLNMSSSGTVDVGDSNVGVTDQHVSRVWSDLTPSRSPGLASPRPKSPGPHRRLNTTLSKVPYGSTTTNRLLMEQARFS